jgi:hypothetical protein
MQRPHKSGGFRATRETVLVDWRHIPIKVIEDAVRFLCEATRTATCEHETGSLHRNCIRRDVGLSNRRWFLRPSEAWVSAPMVSTLS